MGGVVIGSRALALVARCSQGSSGFGLWLQLVHCTCVLTLSEYFKWAELLDFRLSPRLAFAEGSVRMMKLGFSLQSQPSGLTIRTVRARFLSIKYMVGAI